MAAEVRGFRLERLEPNEEPKFNGRQVRATCLTCGKVYWPMHDADGEPNYLAKHGLLGHTQQHDKEVR